MHKPIDFSNYDLLRFAHPLLGSEEAQDTQVLSLRNDKLTDDSEPTWLIKVFHMAASKEVEIPLNEIIPL